MIDHEDENVPPAPWGKTLFFWSAFLLFVVGLAKGIASGNAALVCISIPMAIFILAIGLIWSLSNFLSRLSPAEKAQVEKFKKAVKIIWEGAKSKDKQDFENARQQAEAMLTNDDGFAFGLAGKVNIFLLLIMAALIPAAILLYFWLP